MKNAYKPTYNFIYTKRRKMMRKRQPLIVLIISGVLACSSPAVQQPKQQSAPQGSVRQMSITGEIGKLDYGYVIRGKTPSSTIFTILNPDPVILDPYADSEKIVSIEIRIVSGDNIEIVRIDGKHYPQSSGSGNK
jgi:hypothetical protein